MTNSLTDNNFDLLAYPFRLAPGFPAASARVGTDGQPVLITNERGLEPGTFGKPLMLTTRFYCFSAVLLLSPLGLGLVLSIKGTAAGSLRTPNIKPTQNGLGHAPPA